MSGQRTKCYNSIFFNKKKRMLEQRTKEGVTCKPSCSMSSHTRLSFSALESDGGRRTSAANLSVSNTVSMGNS